MAYDEDVPALVRDGAGMRDALGPALPTRMPSPTRPESAKTRTFAFPADLLVVSTAELNSLCNRMYQELDLPKPDPGTLDRYYQLLDELDRRASSSPEDLALGGLNVQVS